MEFDRCSPSMLAFADLTAAKRFSQMHGGIVVPFAQVVRAFESP
jgi:hypothetical protein